eukprot:g20471.t1
MHPLLEAAAATALIVGAVKPKNDTPLKTLKKLDDWHNCAAFLNVWKSYCHLDTSYLTSLRANCILIHQALMETKCQKLKLKVDEVVDKNETKAAQFIFFSGIQTLVDKAAVDELLEEVVQLMCQFLLDGTHLQLTDVKLKNALNQAECGELLVWKAIAKRMFNGADHPLALGDLFRPEFKTYLQRLIDLQAGFDDPCHPCFTVLKTVVLNVADMNQKACLKLPASCTDCLSGVLKNTILKLDEQKVKADYMVVESCLKDAAVLFEGSVTEELDLEVWESIYDMMGHQKWEPRSRPQNFMNLFKVMDQVIRSPGDDHEQSAKKVNTFITQLEYLFADHHEIGDAFDEFKVQFRCMDLKKDKEGIQAQILSSTLLVFLYEYEAAMKIYEDVDTTWDFFSSEPRDDLYKLVKRKWPQGNPANALAQAQPAVGLGSVNMEL